MRNLALSLSVLVCLVQLSASAARAEEPSDADRLDRLTSQVAGVRSYIRSRRQLGGGIAAAVGAGLVVGAVVAGNSDDPVVRGDLPAVLGVGGGLVMGLGIWQLVVPTEDEDLSEDFLRLPADRTDLSAIPLYTETTVVMVPKDHLVTAVEEVSAADLADEIVLHPLDDTLGWERPPGRPALERPATTADAVELVAAGVGLLAVPQSLARLHHRRDLTYRPLTDAPQSQVALSWPEDATTDQVDDFIGIVRGRTPNSTRGRSSRDPEPEPRQKPKPKAQPEPRKPHQKPARSGAPRPARRGKPRRRS